MTVEGVAITVVIGASSDLTASGDLTATSDSAGSWSVAVPANASYITEGALTITVNATLSGYEAMEVTRQFTVDLTKPAVETATVASTVMTLTYNESLDETSVPDGGAYTVNVNGSSVALATASPVAVSGSTVTITLASAVSDTDTVTVDYTVPTGAGAAPVRDLAGNAADGLTAQSVSGVGVLVTDADNLQTGEDGDRGHVQSQTEDQTLSRRLHRADQQRHRRGHRRADAAHLHGHELGHGTNRDRHRRRRHRPTTATRATRSPSW